MSLPLHILSSEFLPETADLGRLRAVNKGMRDAVDATGREIKKLSDREAVDLGYVSLLKERHTRGVLKDECLTCAAAARNGDLEELKALRAEKFPWDWETCALAAQYGHLDVLKWARENDCPWDEATCAFAAQNGHLETLKWARENNCPWDARVVRAPEQHRERAASPLGEQTLRLAELVPLLVRAAQRAVHAHADAPLADVVGVRRRVRAEHGAEHRAAERPAHLHDHVRDVAQRRHQPRRLAPRVAPRVRARLLHQKAQPKSATVN